MRHFPSISRSLQNMVSQYSNQEHTCPSAGHGVEHSHGRKSHSKSSARSLTSDAMTFGVATITLVRNILHLAQWPLSLPVCLFALVYGAYATQHVYSSLIVSLCTLPGTSVLPLCAAASSVGRVDYPSLVQIQTVGFEQLLDSSASGSSLSLNVKKAEIATNDLATLVRISTLRGRETITNSLREFAHEARLTGRGLQKLSAKIDGTVDSVLAVNQYALTSIQAAAEKDSSSGFLQSLVIWQTPGNFRPTETAISDTFASAMSVLSGSMLGLILAAEIPLANLNRLEEHLSTLHEIVARENADVDASRAELLSYIWTRVGGNGAQLRNYDGHLVLLSNLSEYRRNALVHVVGVLQTLHAMSDAMDELRQRVASPELTGNSIPIEVHMSSIKAGLERLRQGKTKSRSV